MTAKMQINARIFFGLAHMKALFLVSVRLLFHKLISSVIGKKLPLFHLQIRPPFLNIYCHYNYTTKYAENNMTYL